MTRRDLAMLEWSGARWILLVVIANVHSRMISDACPGDIVLRVGVKMRP